MTLAILLLLYGQAAGDGSFPAPSNVRGAEYPRIHSDLRVTFRLKAPDAQKVQVVPQNAGLGKSPYEMTRGEDGFWSVTTTAVRPGFHYYHLLVDGVPVNDPGSETFFGWARQTSGLEVPDASLDFYNAKPVDANPKARYPVLYLQHGAGELVSACESASDPSARIALIEVMGQSGGARALPLLRGGLKSQDAEIKRAAILALTEWPDPAPLPDLLETARHADSPVHQVLALRGALRLIALPAPGRPSRETVRLLGDAMSLARQADEKRAVLSLLPKFPTLEALELARAALNDAEVAAEAKMAADRLERTVKK